MGATVRWPCGAWFGGDDPWAAEARRALGDVVGTWADPADAEGPAPEVVVDATALAPGGDLDDLASRLAAWVAADRPPARVVALVGSGWRGAAPDPGRAGRSGLVVAAARWAAVHLAARRATVNVVALPEGFPASGPAGPAGAEVDVADLVHVTRFLLLPDNDYFTGQVLSLTGGDVLWSNHSM